MSKNKNYQFESYPTQTYNYNVQFKNIDVKIISSTIDKFAPKTSCGFNGLYKINKNYKSCPTQANHCYN